ncbi:MAG: metallophosphoesterase [Treponema sp.]|nr:metallophosphoesterase [Treponema sp.]
MDNKKLLVLSDTHGNVSALKTVLNWAKNRLPPDGTIYAAAFLGDGLSDLRPATDVTGFFCDWKLVSGNNDYGIQMPESFTFDFAGHSFFICHGHRYSMYGGYHALVTAARSSGADIALSGHSHVPYYKTVNGIKLINPGSVGRPRSRLGATFAVIECLENEKIIVEFYKINDNGTVRKAKI